MPAAIYSLLSEDEAKEALRLQSSDAGVLARINRLSKATTELIEELAETIFVERTPTAIAEVHDLAVPQGFLQLRRRPIIGAVVVQMGDPAQTLDAANYYVDEGQGLVMLRAGVANPGGNRRPPSVLTGNSAFVDFPEDYFSRLSGLAFGSGPQSATVTYRGGYVDTTKVPGALKRVAENILARWYREEERKSQGLTSEIAQGFTFATKFADKLVSDEDRAIIARFANASRTARALPPLAAVENGTITGTIVDGVATPVSGATVLACPYGVTATTNGAGAYSITVPVGDVVVKAAKLGVGFNLAAGQLTAGGITVDLALTQPYQLPACA